MPIRSIAVLALAAAIATPALAADFVHTDGTAYTVPAGIEAFSDSRIAANQAGFFIERPGVRRAGVCIVGVTLLNGYANRETWEKMKAAQKADPAATAGKLVKPPETIEKIGGVRDLTLTHGGDGVIYWLTLTTASGRTQAMANGIALIGNRQIYAINCTSEPGLTFTPAELDRIFKLAISVKAMPPTPLTTP